MTREGPKAPKPKDLYKESGVDVAKGEALAGWLKANEGRDDRVVAGIGGFAALYRPDFSGMADPLLVSGTDGVGTKVLLGLQTGRLDGLGIDLVAMCVNDLYTIGGRPLFFLDYYATGILDETQFKAVLTGIKNGCAQAGMPLLGGETAELPGLYEKGHFDLAGFVVGVVDGQKTLGPSRVKVGDRLYAFPSSGFHSNGYSLIRKWVSEKPLEPGVIDRLMEPTRIYFEIPSLLQRIGPEILHALANITGGGISGNLPRVLPEGVVAEIEGTAIPTPGWMREFIEANGTTALEVEGVFNLGAGMIAVVEHGDARRFEDEASALGLAPTPIGHIRADVGPARVRFV